MGEKMESPGCWTVTYFLVKPFQVIYCTTLGVFPFFGGKKKHPSLR